MMADELRYIPGDHYRICDRTGFKVRAERTSMEWTGRIVRNHSFEERQPQDFVRGVADDQTVPDARPRQGDPLTGTLVTNVATPVVAGATSVPVVSSAGMRTGDRVMLTLDSGGVHWTSITSVPTATSIAISPGLPSSTGNVPGTGMVVDLSETTEVDL